MDYPQSPAKLAGAMSRTQYLAGQWRCAALEPWSREHRRVDLAWDQLPGALRADHTTILHHDLAPQHGEDGPALDLPTFPDAVIANVEVRHAQHLMDAGVDKDNVRITAWCN